MIDLELESDTDCPVCGRGAAFQAAREYDTCPRCDWVDDPAAYLSPDLPSETNAYSLNEARSTWPDRAVKQLLVAPLSSFEIAVRDDTIGGYDYVVDGTPLRTVFRAALSLRSSLGPWPSKPYLPGFVSGTPDSPTGRCRLYVCHICGGDDFERAVSADVYRTDDRIIWFRIGAEERDVDTGAWSLNLRSGPTGFAFDATEYRRALHKAAA